MSKKKETKDMKTHRAKIFMCLGPATPACAVLPNCPPWAPSTLAFDLTQSHCVFVVYLPSMPV